MRDSFLAKELYLNKSESRFFLIRRVTGATDFRVICHIRDKKAQHLGTETRYQETCHVSSRAIWARHHGTFSAQHCMPNWCNAAGEVLRPFHQRTSVHKSGGVKAKNPL